MSPDFRTALNRPTDPLVGYDGLPLVRPSTDLAGYDDAPAITHVPADWYEGEVVAGQLGEVAPNPGTGEEAKPCYRLDVALTGGPLPGHQVRKTFMLDKKNQSASKVVLTGLGLPTLADLRRPFPAAGEVVVVKVLVTVDDSFDGTPRNKIKRIERVATRPVPANPNAVDLTAGGEAGA
jgi:hypothetical protein